MDQLAFLTTEAQPTTTGSMSWTVMIIYVAVIGVIFYFMAIRPQKKQQKQMNALISSLAVGDCVVTSGGFYGIVIDVQDEIIIVEFGNNKNCRIPMRKNAVVEVEKPEVEATSTKVEIKKETK